MSDLIIKDPRYFVKLRAVTLYEGPWTEMEKAIEDHWFQVASIRSFHDIKGQLGWTELVQEGSKWDTYWYVKGFPQEVAEAIKNAISP